MKLVYTMKKNKDINFNENIFGMKFGKFQQEMIVLLYFLIQEV